jgi:hypothetical protein
MSSEWKHGKYLVSDKEYDCSVTENRCINIRNGFGQCDFCAIGHLQQEKDKISIELRDEKSMRINETEAVKFWKEQCRLKDKRIAKFKDKEAKAISYLKSGEYTLGDVSGVIKILQGVKN